MDYRHLKGLFAGAVAAAMVISAIPHMPAVASDITETVNVGDTSSVYTNITTDENSKYTLFTVNSDGTYVFTGSGSDIFIEVADGVNADLVLRNLVIDNSTTAQKGSIINGAGSSDVDIELSGVSAFNCSTSKKQGAIAHDDYNNTLTISGDGSLSVSGAQKDAIKYDLGTVEIESGTVLLDNCYSDGIQAEVVEIKGGTVDISTTYENASTCYYGSNNYNNITESGNTKTETITFDTGSHKGIKAGSKAKTYVYTTSTDESIVAGTTYTDTASGGLYISGGVVNIDTMDAGLKANRISSGSGYTKTSTGVYIIGGQTMVSSPIMTSRSPVEPSTLHPEMTVYRQLIH